MASSNGNHQAHWVRTSLRTSSRSFSFPPTYTIHQRSATLANACSYYDYPLSMRTARAGALNRRTPQSSQESGYYYEEHPIIAHTRHYRQRDLSPAGRPRDRYHHHYKNSQYNPQFTEPFSPPPPTPTPPLGGFLHPSSPTIQPSLLLAPRGTVREFGTTETSSSGAQLSPPATPRKSNCSAMRKKNVSQNRRELLHRGNKQENTKSTDSLSLLAQVSCAITSCGRDKEQGQLKDPASPNESDAHHLPLLPQPLKPRKVTPTVDSRRDRPSHTSRVPFMEVRSYTAPGALQLRDPSLQSAPCGGDDTRGFAPPRYYSSPNQSRNELQVPHYHSYAHDPMGLVGIINNSPVRTQWSPFVERREMHPRSHNYYPPAAPNATTRVPFDRFTDQVRETPALYRPDWKEQVSSINNRSTGFSSLMGQTAATAIIIASSPQNDVPGDYEMTYSGKGAEEPDNIPNPSRYSLHTHPRYGDRLPHDRYSYLSQQERPPRKTNNVHGLSQKYHVPPSATDEEEAPECSTQAATQLSRTPFHATSDDTGDFREEKQSLSPSHSLPEKGCSYRQRRRALFNAHADRPHDSCEASSASDTDKSDINTDRSIETENKENETENKENKEKNVLIKKNFSWRDYPELERFLISHRDEFLLFSTKMNYTPQQKRYNNWLTKRVLQVAEEHHYIFDVENFEFSDIRDRIRCYYKKYIHRNMARKHYLSLQK